MAIHITRLNGGNIIIGSSGSSGHAETRFTLQDGTVETYNITGSLDGQWMMNNGYFDDETHEWKKTITQADIGNTVTDIGANAFSRCRSLTGVTIPDSVTRIGDGAFSYCISMASVTIPGNVTHIGFEAFSGLGLTSVTIPNSVTTIGDSAFSYCSGLTSVTIPDSVTRIGGSVFVGCGSLTSVTITSNGGNAENVKQAMIGAIEDTSISDNITWNMPN